MLINLMSEYLAALLPQGLVSVLTTGFLVSRDDPLRGLVVSTLVSCGKYTLPLAEIEADNLIRTHEKEIREHILPIFRVVSDRLMDSTAFCRDPNGAEVFCKTVFGGR